MIPMNILRALNPGATPQISKTDALRLAEKHATATGLLWGEPIRAQRDLGHWLVIANANHYDGMTLIVVDGNNGTIRSSHTPTQRLSA
jgi:hypothetical protein